MTNFKSNVFDLFPKRGQGKSAGLTIVELLVSMTIMSISLVAMYMTIVDTQRSIVVDESRENGLVFNTINLELVDRAFLRKSQGAYAACTVNLTSGFSVACDQDASYCTCMCDADSNCNVLYIRQNDPLDPVGGYKNETIVYSTCEDVGTTLEDFTFDSSCGLTCAKGRRPVVYVQQLNNSVKVWDQKYPSAANTELKRSDLLASSFCVKRYSAVAALEVHFNAYTWNGFEDDREIQYKPGSRLLQEVAFSNDSIMVKDK